MQQSQIIKYYYIIIYKSLDSTLTHKPSMLLLLFKLSFKKRNIIINYQVYIFNSFFLDE
jgi:hypothetical protein